MSKGTYVSNKQVEIPTHFCWVCKKVFIFPDNGRNHECLHCKDGVILLAYFDDLPEGDALDMVAALTSPH